MSKARIAPRRPAPDETLEELLFTVEDRCNRAVAILRVTARAVEGEEVGLHEEDVPSLFGAALEGIAKELESVSDQALTARTRKAGR